MPHLLRTPHLCHLPALLPQVLQVSMSSSHWPQLPTAFGIQESLRSSSPPSQSLHQPAPDEQQGLLLLQGHHHRGG